MHACRRLASYGAGVVVRTITYGVGVACTAANALSANGRTTCAQVWHVQCPSMFSTLFSPLQHWTLEYLLKWASGGVILNIG